MRRSVREPDRANRQARVLVVDDHPLFAQGTVEVLARMPGVDMIGFAVTLEEAQTKISALDPDVVVCEVRLVDRPEGFGLPGARDADDRPAVICLGRSTDAALIARIRSAGVSGLLPKSVDAETLRGAIIAVANGSNVFPRTVPATSSRSRTPTPREIDVLRLVADGRSNGEIATRLGISESTVETHIQRLRARYGQANRTQLAIMAERQGWLAEDSDVELQQPPGKR